MSARREAFLLAATRQDDQGLAQLRTPAADVEAFADALSGGFTVRRVIDRPAAEFDAELTAFFAGAAPDDTLLLYVACHALQHAGDLIFAATDARRDNPAGLTAATLEAALAATAAEHVVIILDCCFTGSDAVDLTGLAKRAAVFITATDTTEYVLDNGMIRGRGRPSRLTPDLVAALTDPATDLDGDGRVTAGELCAHLGVDVRHVTEGDLMIVPAATAPSARAARPAAVDVKPALGLWGWAVRVFSAGSVLLLTSLVLMLSLGWFLYRVSWFPTWRTEALDLITWMVMAGGLLMLAGTAMAATSYVARRVRR
ncbi:caspase family protein [Nonomuraea sp. NBC_01738]|uniref:caspase family protein n=1 Tax=Nonomuraea sp. NBC_01738 TaxID=2976003 RepID=UPI002E157906|nr:caspase family protein [Nonomuraea sp. NBC_01738]